MLKNEAEYRHTVKHANEIRQILADLEASNNADSIALTAPGLREFLAQLEREAAEYEARTRQPASPT